MGEDEENDIAASGAHDSQEPEDGVAPRSGRFGLVRRVLPVLFGFIAGAVFWHLVGFWSLVDKMVFHGPRETAVAVSTPTPKSSDGLANARAIVEPSAIVTRSQIAAGGPENSLGRYGLSAANCTTLAQKTPGGRVVEVPCRVMESQGRYGITTGSIGVREGQGGPSSPATRNWATSLDITASDVEF